MRNKLFSKLATVWLFVLISLVVNLTAACGHDPEHYNDDVATAHRATEQRECQPNMFCKQQ